MNEIYQNSDAIDNFYREISLMISKTQINVQKNINSEMILLYWNIGKYIKTNVLESGKAEYGKSVIDNISDKLSKDYGRGFGRRNLFNMTRFFSFYKEYEIVQTLSAQLSWSHIIELIRIDNDVKREFYTLTASNEYWSVRALKDRINSMLFERTILSKLPDETIKNDLMDLRDSHKMSTNLFFKDPYILDFLELEDTFSEKDLENSILHELEKFMMEFGRDFAFIGRQVRISIGDKDYYIDLLFYHRKLKRLVLIELKLGEFLPEHKGQVELYLRWLDKNEKNEGEESPIGIILCAEKSNETVELLELDKSGIHVAQYLTQLPPKEVLEKKLHKAIENAKKIFK